ncbi:hypothetical protein ACFX19_044657 [Malus domestica]
MEAMTTRSSGTAACASRARANRWLRSMSRISARASGSGPSPLPRMLPCLQPSRHHPLWFQGPTQPPPFRFLVPELHAGLLFFLFLFHLFESTCRKLLWSGFESPSVIPWSGFESPSIIPWSGFESVRNRGNCCYLSKKEEGIESATSLEVRKKLLI